MQIKQKEVYLSGLSTSPNDLTCEDGNLAIALNVVHEDSAIKNAYHSAPKIIGSLEGDYEALFQHTINELTKHIIIFKDRTDRDADGNVILKYFWIARNDDGDIENISTRVYFSELERRELVTYMSVGNTLIFYTEDRVYYYLWKDLKYNFLGNEMPEIEMSFGLTPHLYDYVNETSGNTSHKNNGFRTYLPETENMHGEDSNQKHNPFAEQDLTDITNGVFGVVSLFKEWCDKNGYFSQPFFVRYALRLFDGSHTKASSPILMMPSTGTNPVIPITKMYYDRDEEDKGNNWMSYTCVGVGCSMEYFLKDNGAKDGLNQWKDIIKGIDIFVSEPIYTYDQTEKVKWFSCPSWEYNGVSGEGRTLVPTTLFEYMSEKSDVTYCKNGSTVFDSKTTMFNEYRNLYGANYFGAISNIRKYDDFYVRATYNGRDYDLAHVDDHVFDFFYDEIFNPLAFIHLPTKSSAEIDKEIKDCANFYFIKELKTDKLVWGNVRTSLEIEKNELKAVATHERLVDDYDSHHTIIPHHTYSYNERLNMANVKKIMFEGFSPFSMSQRVNAVNPYTATIETSIIKNGKSIVLRKTCTDTFDGEYSFPYIFYPDVDVKEFKVFKNYQCLENYVAEEHKGLNGSYVYIGLDKVKGSRSNVSGSLKDTTDKEVNLPNYLYTSNVGNPFAFASKNVERVGGGKIIAIVPQAVAMSQGQFGSFPMVAFTTDGIWSLSVSETGGWSAKQPFSRDVLLSEKALLLLDRDIIFATTRGLMQINGSNVECISEVFDGENDTFTTLYKDYINKAISTYTGTSLGGDSPTFTSFVQNGVFSYDYTHQRIVVGNANYPFVFVFNLKDKLWTCESIKFHSVVNSYPDALVNVDASYIDEDKKLHIRYNLIDLTKEGNASAVGVTSNGFIITRPLKLTGTGLKTITSVVANGVFKQGVNKNTGKIESSVDLLLYSSNDMRTWALSNTCRGHRMLNLDGTPHRFYRVGVITRLAEGESIQSLTINFEDREHLSATE